MKQLGVFLIFERLLRKQSIYYIFLITIMKGVGTSIKREEIYRSRLLIFGQ